MEAPLALKWLKLIAQGDALGYELLGLQPVLIPHAKLQ